MGGSPAGSRRKYIKKATSTNSSFRIALEFSSQKIVAAREVKMEIALFQMIFNNLSKHHSFVGKT
jgi:hypothetical protein